MNAWAQREGLPGMGYIMWRDRVKEASAKVLVHKIMEVQAERKGKTDEAKWLRDKGKEASSESGVINREVETDPASRIEAVGPIAKNIGPERSEAVRRQLGLKAGDAAFFLAGKPAEFLSVAAKARVLIGEELGLANKDRFEFCWIVDFPMYEWDEQHKKIEFGHNPFSMPQGGLGALEAATSDDDFLAIKAHQYDLVCNGYELGSGAIRNHRPDLMVKAFEIAGYGKDVVEEKFAGLLNAFRYGAPPHGGCAFGLERIVMLLTDQENIREVTMFPMNQQAEDLLLGAPATASAEQLKDVHIRVVPPIAEKKG
jgi:aspartyl-tRNA synthetase